MLEVTIKHLAQYLVTVCGKHVVKFTGKLAAKVDRYNIFEGAPFSHEECARPGLDTHSCCTEVN